MSRSITCTNKTNNFSLTFSEDAFQPFILASVDGLYLSQNNVSIMNNTMTDGGTYQGSVARVRNIVLTVMEDPRIADRFIYDQSNRDVLYTLFRKNERGTLIYTENDKSRKIEYYSEGVSRAPKGSRLFTISLICPNPMFEDIDANNVAMANWISNFEFTHEFLADGEELGYRSAERSVNIVNDVAADNVGITITINAVSSVSNITITHIEKDEHITVGTTAKPFTMVSGDMLVITTGLNNKHVKYTHNGAETEVNEYLSEDSEFIQLQHGNNNIAYSAEAGEAYMSVNISYNFEYEGA